LSVRLGEVGKESRKTKIESGKEKDGEREKKGEEGEGIVNQATRAEAISLIR